MTPRLGISSNTQGPVLSAAAEASIDHAFASRYGQYIVGYLHNQPCGLAEAYNIAADDEKSNVVKRAILYTGIALDLHDIPTVMRCLQDLYVAAAQRPDPQEYLDIIDIIFLAGPGRAACGFLKHMLPMSVRRKLCAARSILSDPELSSHVRELLTLAITTVMHIEPVVPSSDAEACHVDQDEHDSVMAEGCLAELWNMLLADYPISAAMSPVFLMKAEKLMASKIAPHLKVMIFTLASLIRRERRFDIGDSATLRELQTAQQEQWQNDGVRGKEPPNKAGAVRTPFPVVSAVISSGSTIAGFGTQLHKLSADEAKAYAERPVRRPDPSSDDLDTILDDKIRAQHQVYRAIVTLPEICDDDKHSELKEKMNREFGEFLDRHFNSTADHKLAISALAVNIVEVLCSY
ncbi:hypothetical protein Slin15195_G106850 [Septoria linicola]|uniref:Uncharacterized protein n=1 Tax=Septoria linicola TaxID=215465 RepID=A0A9Q9B570_9PEZI|nr:hypothetical protein Slin14017_G069820 [Septoria linicola]USW57366.1 hypothetical protein Slin15195_G106850 [Septoria linicola]